MDGLEKVFGRVGEVGGLLDQGRLHKLGVFLNVLLNMWKLQNLVTGRSLLRINLQ